MENESGAMDLPDPDMFLTVHGIIREGQLVVLLCPYCAETHRHELGPPPVEGVREAPCEVDGLIRQAYNIRLVETGILPGLYSRTERRQAKNMLRLDEHAQRVLVRKAGDGSYPGVSLVRTSGVILGQ
jgi:hypothetical protein